MRSQSSSDSPHLIQLVCGYVHPLIWLVRHLQRAAIVPLLPTWLTARRLAQCLDAADGLSFYGFLRGRSVAVARVLPGLSYLASSSRSFLFSFLKLRISLCRAAVLRLRLQISECCESIVSRINRISSVMACSVFDMSVTF